MRQVLSTDAGTKNYAAEVEIILVIKLAILIPNTGIGFLDLDQQRFAFEKIIREESNPILRRFQEDVTTHLLSYLKDTIPSVAEGPSSRIDPIIARAVIHAFVTTDLDEELRESFQRLTVRRALSTTSNVDMEGVRRWVREQLSPALTDLITSLPLPGSETISSSPVPSSEVLQGYDIADSDCVYARPPSTLRY